MNLKFTVSVTADRESGKFVSKEDVAEQVREALEQADPGSVEVDESTYTIAEWVVEDAI